MPKALSSLQSVYVAKRSVDAVAEISAHTESLYEGEQKNLSCLPWVFMSNPLRVHWTAVGV